MKGAGYWGLAAVIAGIATAAFTGGCGGSGARTEELVVYSARNEHFVEELLRKFEADTGIRVRALHAGNVAVNRIKEEGRRPWADIFISNDIGALEHLRLEGLLEGYEPEGIDSIQPRYRAADPSWFALSARTRVLMYNRDLITSEEMPGTLWELAAPRWKGLFAVTRGGNSSMIAHVAALRREWGDEKTAEWLAGIRGNAGAVMRGHGDIRRAVGAGEFAFGLVNNYYYHQQLREPANNNVGVVYPDQGEGEMGAVVNAAGVALVRNGPNTAGARRFLDWILLPENQREFSYSSLEVPVNPAIRPAEGASAITDYRVHGMPLGELGKVWEDTRRFIEKSGFDIELR